nr:putative zinc finger, CCHC-type [Tanacetum cinerariifolium]
MARDTPFDMGYENGIGMGKSRMFDQKLVVVVCSKVVKMFKSIGVVDGSTANANQASFLMRYAAVIETIRIDNGTEIVNKACLAFLSSKRIVHQKSIPYTPQQNGVVERKHRHFLKTAKAIRGFDQKEGRDYKHTFSYVAKLAIVRVLIALATTKGWPLHQLDINNAFLYGFIDEDIYMQPPAGCNDASPGEVCKLKKSLYGLKQASRQWNHELSKFLQALGFTQSKNDCSLFVKKHKDEFIAVLVYVDDILITGKGNLLSNPEAYRRLVGRLLYLTMTRPDISYVVQHLSQFVSAPTDLYMQVGLHLLKYLKGTVSKGLFYPVQPHLHITGFFDADWVACLMTRRSLTSYCVFLGHCLVSWKTKKQPTVSRSSTEAEYRAMAVTTREILWLSFLLKDLHVPVKLPITLFCDNKSA